MINSKRDLSFFHVFDDNRVGAHPGMRANFDCSQDFGAGADIDMVANLEVLRFLLRVPIVTC